MTPISLARNKLIPILDKVDNTAHAGLLVQRGLRVWQGKETKDSKDKDDKKDLIRVITNVKSSELYQLAFDRWLLHTYKGDGSANLNKDIASLSATIDGRLMTGLSIGGTLETGVITHHTYGMPLLAGSAVKGAVRAYAENLFSKRDAEGKIVLIKDDKDIERSSIDEAMQPILNILFGADEKADQASAGYLIWHDAWWIPTLTKEGKYSSSDDAKPFVGEIVTVHHPNYYSYKTGDALDMESPVPNQQLAIQGSFYFVIEGESQWVDFAKKLLHDMLQQFGMGTKGASGYGYFKIDEQLLRKHYLQLLIDTPSSATDDDPYANLRLYLIGLDEKELIESLSKGLNKLCQKFDLDKSNHEHCKNISQIVLKHHHEVIKGWDGQAGNKEKAFTFIQKYK